MSAFIPQQPRRNSSRCYPEHSKPPLCGTRSMERYRTRSSAPDLAEMGPRISTWTALERTGSAIGHDARDVFMRIVRHARIADKKPDLHMREAGNFAWPGCHCQRNESGCERYVVPSGDHRSFADWMRLWRRHVRMVLVAGASSCGDGAGRFSIHRGGSPGFDMIPEGRKWLLGSVRAASYVSS